MAVVLLGPGVEAVGTAAAGAGAVVFAAFVAADVFGLYAVFAEELVYHFWAFVVFVQFCCPKFMFTSKLHGKIHPLFFWKTFYFQYFISIYFFNNVVM